jgi:hypothetical protein
LDTCGGEEMSNKRKFEIEMTVTATIELDNEVIDVVDDKWRSQLYNLRTPEEIARHIAYNMVANQANLSSIDGWADQSDDNAKFIVFPQWATESVKELK